MRPYQQVPFQFSLHRVDAAGNLSHSGFLDPKAPRKLMSRLHRLANRAGLTVEEVQILRGIARAIDEKKS